MNMCMPMTGEDLIAVLLKVLTKDSQDSFFAAHNCNSGSEQSRKGNTDTH
jgi:hypothetical protein